VRDTLFSSSIVVFISFILVAEPVYAGPYDKPALSDEEIDTRLDDLTQSLHFQQINAQYWEYGWGSFDAGTMIYSAVQVSQDHDRKNRNTDIVQASESLIGLATVVLRPLPAFDADSVCTDPTSLRQSVWLQCLALKEALLERSAQRANEPYELLPHLGNLGFNLLAGLIVWRVADARHALTTAIPGEIIGEMQLWTMPKQPMADFDQYEVQFGPLPLQTEGPVIPATGLTFTYKF